MTISQTQNENGDLTWRSATELRDMIGKREISPIELMDNVLARIERLDPILKAFTFLDREGARRSAREAEAAAMRGDELGPLHGIPFAVKDHIPVAGLPGGIYLKVATPEIQKQSHFGVERLLKAGAIAIGTNTMLGAGSGIGITGAGTFNGFNWDAEARNPWDTSKVPGWSSSGGAAAVASGMLPFALGTDGGGSTRLPAAYSGTVGVHPTGGLIPGFDYRMVQPPAGITVGPLARSVRDAALVTQIMAGPDGRDPFSIQQDPDDYIATLDAGVKGMKLAWTDDFGFAAKYAAPETDRLIAAVRAEAMKLNDLGARVTPTDMVWEDFYPGRMAQWQSYYPNPALPPLSEEAMREGFEARGRNWDRFRALFCDHDLILTVTANRVARDIPEFNAAWTTDAGKYAHGNFMGTYCSHTDMFNWLKFPAVAVPCGFLDGLPVSLQIAGPAGSEAKIFRVAQAYQQAFPRRERPPVD